MVALGDMAASRGWCERLGGGALRRIGRGVAVTLAGFESVSKMFILDCKLDDVILNRVGLKVVSWTAADEEERPQWPAQ